MFSPFYHYSTEKRLPYDANVVENVYQTELLGSKFSIKRVMLLEFSQYLENYLWPNFTPAQATRAHILSMVCMVNEKFRERVPAWEAFKKNPTKKFPGKNNASFILNECVCDYDIANKWVPLISMQLFTFSEGKNRNCSVGTNPKNTNLFQLQSASLNSTFFNQFSLVSHCHFQCKTHCSLPNIPKVPGYLAKGSSH